MDSRLKDVSWQARSALERHGIDSLEAVAAHTFNELMRLDRVGRKLTKELQDILIANGMCLKPSSGPFEDSDYLPLPIEERS